MNKKILTPMRSYSQRRVYYIYREYFRMLQTANLDPIIIGPSSDDTLDFLVTHCDGLLLSGGFDIDPVLYHQVLNPLTNKEEAELEELEIKLIHKFSKAHKPILGICRGIQTINVAFNGTLIQDIPETKKYDNHLQENLEGYHHLVKTIPHTKLNKYLGNEFMTNSFHHQALMILPLALLSVQLLLMELLKELKKIILLLYNGIRKKIMIKFKQV